MAIERKDRSFEKIFDEVSLEKVPLAYVNYITINTIDGGQIHLESETIKNMTSQDEIFQGLGTDDIVDFAVSLDYDAIKEDITKEVKIVLGTLFEEE